MAPPAVEGGGVHPRGAQVAPPRPPVGGGGTPLLEVGLPAAARGAGRGGGGGGDRRGWQRAAGLSGRSGGRGQGEELSAIHGLGPPVFAGEYVMPTPALAPPPPTTLWQNWMRCSSVRVDYLHETE